MTADRLSLWSLQFSCWDIFVGHQINHPNMEEGWRILRWLSIKIYFILWSKEGESIFVICLFPSHNHRTAGTARSLCADLPHFRSWLHKHRSPLHARVSHFLREQAPCQFRYMYVSPGVKAVKISSNPPPCFHACFHSNGSRANHSSKSITKIS